MLTRETLMAELTANFKNAVESVPRPTGKSEEAKAREIVDYYSAVYGAFRSVLDQSQDITSKTEFDAICESLDNAQIGIEASEVTQRIAQKIKWKRTKIKSRLAEAHKLVQRKPLSGAKIVQSDIDLINQIRDACGFTPISWEQEQLSPEQLNALRAIAVELGEEAVAEYLCAVYSDRFAYNNRTLVNLRQWLGDIETFRSANIEDIPTPLLTLPQLGKLRELLFNRMRDKYFSLFRIGIDAVHAELESSLERAHEDAHTEFIHEVMDYFTATDSIKCPQRMNPTIGNNEIFPGRHQLVAMQEIKRLKQILVGDKPGGGKTGSAIAAFEHLKDEGMANRALIICPSAIIGEWEKRLSSGTEGYFNDGQEPNVIVIRSGDPDRSETWENAKNADYVIMSLAMLRHSTEGIQHEELAKQIDADYFIFDEAHNARNPDANVGRKRRKEAKRAEMNASDAERIFRVSQCESIKNGYTVLLTGTPVPNTIRDVAAHLRLLNAGQPRITDEKGIPQGIDFCNIKSLSKAISRNHTRLVRNLLLLRMLNRSKNECLPVGTDLIIEDPRESELDIRERSLYDAVYEDPYFTATQKIQMLRRICLHPYACADSKITGMSKFADLQECVDEFLLEFENDPLSHAGKIVIANEGFARGVTRDFRHRNDETSDKTSYLAGRLDTVLKKRKVPVFILDGNNTGTNHLHGPDGQPLFDIDGAPMTPTRQIIARFRDYPGSAVLCTRTDVIGEGVDLSFASRAILLCPTSTNSVMEQFIARLYRKGQKHDVRLRILLCAGTIERGLADYARTKQAIINDLLHGKALTRAEEEILNEDSTRVRRGGFLAYETKTPAQKVMFIFSQIMGVGKEKIREFFELNGGKFARELAEHYHTDWDTSFAGNQNRLNAAIIQSHIGALQNEFDVEELQMADIACGGLSMAKTFEHSSDIQVWSSDICLPMLEVGKRLFQKSPNPRYIAHCGMDELPYKNGSMHLVVHSLALHYTKHSMKGPGGDERITALREVNRVLAKGGIAVISLPPFPFKGTNRFSEFTQAVERYFGFEVIEGETGDAHPVDAESSQKFESFVITLRKIGEPVPENTISITGWKALALRKKVAVSSGKGQERKPARINVHPESDPSFIEKFRIGNTALNYNMSASEAKSKRQFTREQEEYSRIQGVIGKLIEEYGSIDEIPLEKLLSISLTEIKNLDQIQKDRYFKKLIQRFGGVENIPIEDISKESPIILLKGNTKRGSFVCLAYLSGKKPRGFGKRYFYEKEFSVDANTEQPEKQMYINA